MPEITEVNTSEKATSVTSTQKKSSRLKWLAIYIVIGILVYGVFYYFAFTRNSSNNQMTGSENSGFQKESDIEKENPEEETVVTVTKEGFDPKTVTIKPGVKVTWINRSGGKATVDSSPHPAHTDNPYMNLGEFSDGDSMSLLFDVKGTYKYHNHLNSSQSGTIIVE